MAEKNNGVSSNTTATQPLWLLAEITYQCPLQCAFCYNPTDFDKHTQNELDTDAWIKVLRQSRDLGAAQLGISGGEPLLRKDIEEIVQEASSLGYYSNLITSGAGMNEKRIDALKDGGLDHIQLSMHDITEEINNFITNTKTFKLKQKIAAMIKDRGYPMVLNVVLHRYNIDHIQEILEMAEGLGADYIELANTQYYGWSLVNRDQLMPKKEQVLHAEKVTNEFRERIGNKMKIFFVVPDYYDDRPKKCMNGWGEVFMIVTANGDVLPCHSARVIPNLEFPNVKNTDVKQIWYDSPAFNKFRGDDWMKEPCRSCSEKEKDLGGCRCQALLLSGDAESADPVCTKSPNRHLIDQAIKDTENPGVEAKPIMFRSNKNSKKISDGEEKERLAKFHAIP